MEPCKIIDLFDVDRKINMVLDKEYFNEIDMLYFFSMLRQKIEKNDTKDVDLVKFYANWLLHPKVSRKNTVGGILDALKCSLIAHYSNDNDVNHIGVEFNKILSLSLLKKEIGAIITYSQNEKVKSLIDFDNILLCSLIGKNVELDFEQTVKVNSNGKGFDFYGFRIASVFEDDNSYASLYIELLSKEVSEVNSRVLIQLTKNR